VRSIDGTRPPANQGGTQVKRTRADARNEKLKERFQRNSNATEKQNLDTHTVNQKRKAKATQNAAENAADVTKKAGFFKKTGNWVKNLPKWAKFTGAGIGVLAAGVAGYELVKRNANKE
jgi:hypothetical protein